MYLLEIVKVFSGFEIKGFKNVNTDRYNVQIDTVARAKCCILNELNSIVNSFLETVIVTLREIIFSTSPYTIWNRMRFLRLSRSQLFVRARLKHTPLDTVSRIKIDTFSRCNILIRILHEQCVCLFYPHFRTLIYVFYIFFSLFFAFVLVLNYSGKVFLRNLPQRPHSLTGDSRIVRVQPPRSSSYCERDTPDVRSNTRRVHITACS